MNEQELIAIGWTQEQYDAYVQETIQDTTEGFSTEETSEYQDYLDTLA